MRIPYSQRTTYSLPSAVMYSMLISSSSIVLERPRFNRIGLLILPSPLSSSKPYTLCVPVWVVPMSPNSSRCGTYMISVTIDRPVLFFAPSKSSRLSAFMFRKEYGEARGLNVLPRKNLMPTVFTRPVTPQIYFSSSTEQGLTIRVNEPLPIFCLPGRVVTVLSG